MDDSEWRSVADDPPPATYDTDVLVENKYGRMWVAHAFEVAHQHRCGEGSVRWRPLPEGRGDG